ncbi:hypothetical protein Aperf_G00000021728 [Anoplocephala perfoliata]
MRTSFRPAETPNIVAMLGYMKSRGFMMHISQSMVELKPSIPTPWVNCCNIPSEDCRAVVREQMVARLRNRESRIHQLLEIVRERDLRHFQDLNRKFSTAERASMMAQFSVNYRAMVQNCIDIIRAERIQHERDTDYMKLCEEELYRAALGRARHRCKCPATAGKRMEVITWLNNIFVENGIDAYDFVDKLIAVLDTRYHKINALVLMGQTNTGKSMIANLAVSLLNYGTVQRRVEQSPFEGPLDRTLALLEEPRIAASNIEDMKNLLGGELQVKYSRPAKLERLPIIITTNEYLGERSNDGDADALESGIFLFKLHKQITSEAVNGVIDACSVDLCSCDFIH